MAFDLLLQSGGYGETWSTARHDHPGLLIDRRWPWASGSPDGCLEALDGSRALVEFKAPGARAKKDMSMQEAAANVSIYDVKKSKAEGGALSGCPSQYWAQCQWNAGLMGRCDLIFFVVWTKDRKSEDAEVEMLAECQRSGCRNRVWATRMGTLHVVEIEPDRAFFENAVATCHAFWKGPFMRHCTLLSLKYLQPGEVEADFEPDEPDDPDVGEPGGKRKRGRK